MTDANRTAIGGVLVAMRPELLLQELADAARGRRPLALFAVRTDGAFLYPDDPGLIGRQMN